MGEFLAGVDRFGGVRHPFDADGGGGAADFYECRIVKLDGQSRNSSSESATIVSGIGRPRPGRAGRASLVVDLQNLLDRRNRELDQRFEASAVLRR